MIHEGNGLIYSNPRGQIVVEIVTIINTYQWEHNLVKINIVKHSGLLTLLSIVGWWKWKDSMVGWWMQSHSIWFIIQIW